MNEKLTLLLKELFEKKYTGQLRLNFHEGNLSEKIEKKENIKLLNEEITPEVFARNFWPTPSPKRTE